MARQIPSSWGAVYILTDFTAAISKIGHTQRYSVARAIERAREYSRQYDVNLCFFALVPTAWPREVEVEAHRTLADMRLGGRARELFTIKPALARDRVEIIAEQLVGIMLERGRRPVIRGEGFVMLRSC
jgi:hypothetical protein